MLAYLNFPQWIRPEIIPGLPVRWYGLMYLVAFYITYALVKRQRKLGEIDTPEDDLVNFFFWALIGLILGARIFATTIYDPSHYYITHPWMIFWPFRDGVFTGLQGMSYHGGVTGAVVATLVYCRKKKLSWFRIADVYSAGIPLGYTFGRLGNFINGELWGRVTARPWGMVFPHAQRFSSNLEWVAETASRIGMDISASPFVNLPRHPSQLYEAFFEGVVLWLVLWFVVRPRKKHDGAVISCYLAGYGLVRFFIEYFREPDADMGFVLGAARGDTALVGSFLSISTGQILCALMIAAGVFLYFFSGMVSASSERKHAEAQDSSVRKGNERRKIRKKLK